MKNPNQKPFNKLEIFTVVKEHLLKQMKKSQVLNLANKTTCAYRGKNNLKCAIGVLVPDEYYEPKIEGGSLDNRNLYEALSYKIETLDQQNFIQYLQAIHDQYEPENWENRLNNFYKEHIYMYI